MNAPPYHVRIGPVNEIVLEGIGAASERRAATVIDPAGRPRAVILEPKARGGPDWDEDAWRRAVGKALLRIFHRQPIVVCWDIPPGEPSEGEPSPPSATGYLGGAPV
jgi:hypothetical protein